MNASPSSKRIRLESSPSPHDHDERTKDDDLEQEHCTICLQPFLDRTIIPVCAHEFCFECILLWSEQSRKCPLCSRSFDDSYLIHHIRSQYDYQKHYLPPRTSPPPPLTGESRAAALRSTRRERQWGRRQRRQREEADQLERAIARRRWLYQHHLYAKHIASNPYTRYRPFPTPAQFAASPDLISRMTTFLRRELHVWPNLDVEFLTTYTISLMKSIDIRSESAVKLLSEFLDLDTSYAAGARHVNAEHFAHEIYSYLRSPYRDLNMYDQTAQYDTPPEISPPQEIERGNRWSAERSPSRRSRSWSNSRSRSPVPRRENSARRSPIARHDRDSSAEARHEDKPNHRRVPNRPPRGREDDDSRNYSSVRRHSPPDGVQPVLRNDHSRDVPEASNPAILAENQDSNDSSVQPHSRSNEKQNTHVMEDVEEIAAGTDTLILSASQGDDSAALLAANRAGVTRFIDGPIQEAGDEVADYVDRVGGGSSANPHPSRKRSAGLNVLVHPRNRTISASVQAYLSRPAAPWHPREKHPVSRDERPTRVSDGSRTETRPRPLLRLTDGSDSLTLGKVPSPPATTVERTVDGDDDVAAEHPHHGRRLQSCVFSSNGDSFIGANGTIHGDDTEDGAIRLGRVDEGARLLCSADGSLGRGFPPELGVTRVDGHPEPIEIRSAVDSAIDPHPGSPKGRTLGCAAVPDPLADEPRENGHGRTCMDTSPSSAGAVASPLFHGDERAGSVESVAGDSTSRGAMGMSRASASSSSRSASISTPTSTGTESKGTTDVDTSALERRLRARARVRVRLAAIKGTAGGQGTGPSASASGSDSGVGLVPG